MNRLTTIGKWLVLSSLVSSLGSLELGAQEKPTARIEFDREKGIWNPLPVAPDNQPQVVKVLVLNYDPISAADKHRSFTQIFGWTNAALLAADYKASLERASGGYLKIEIVEWRNLNEIYAQQDGYRYTIDEYIRNRRAGGGWHEKGGGADYPGIIREQNVVPLIDDGLIDEVWIFSDHFFGLWEASMAGPGAFFINGGVYGAVPSQRAFAFYGFNYERGTAEMLHNTSHRTESTLNRFYGEWNLKAPRTDWDKFSANHDQSNGAAGVGTCHFPANAAHGYDYGNTREVMSWADDFLSYPRLTGAFKPVSRESWTDGRDHHRGYMRWYFAHLPRARGQSESGLQNNWWKYVYDFNNYTADGKPKPSSAQLHSGDLFELGGADHAIKIAYRSSIPLDMSTLGDDDLSVTGLDKAALSVKFAAASDMRSGTQRVATYRISAPHGKWQEADRGVYAVSLREGAVTDVLGKPLPAAELGTFLIGSPKATKLATPVSVKGTELPTVRLAEAAGATIPSRDAVSIVVEYADHEGIEVDSLGLADIRVFGPNGFHQFPPLKSQKMEGKSVRATYTVAPPENGWTADHAGTYVIEVKGYQVHATAGRFVADGKLGVFEVRTAK